MKRKLSLFLSLVLLISVMVPAYSFAAPDQQLEDAIRAVKAKIDIPDGLEFYHDLYMTEDGQKIWTLYWERRDISDGLWISAAVREDGTLLSYSKYTLRGTDSQKKFPSVSRAQARELAESFINKVNPDIMPQLLFINSEPRTLVENSYNIRFARIINQVPFYYNTVNVRVDCETGEITEYYCNWNEDLEFDSPAGAIDLSAAQQAFMDNLGIKIIYRYKTDDDGLHTYPVYVPKYDSNTYFVDAFTGERIKIEGRFYGIPEGLNGATKDEDAVAGMGERAVQLTPEELAAIEEAGNMLTLEQAESRARSLEVLGLTENHELAHSSRAKSWPDRNRYIWSLGFMREASNNQDYSYVSVTFDAVTGEVLSFYKNTVDTGEEGRFDREQAKAKVEEFLRQFASEKFKKTEYVEEAEEIIRPLDGGNTPAQYYFNYVRKVNGAEFPDNGIAVVFDAVNDTIAGYNVRWFGDDFASLDQVANEEDVYEIMFEKIGLELQYKLSYETPEGSDEQVPVTRLVYAFESGKPLYFDAFTGAVLDAAGNPWEEEVPVEYTDISGHYAEDKIIALAEYGIYLEGTEFMPDKEITQFDFLILLNKVFGFYFTSIKPTSGQEEIDRFYWTLEREGILDKGEKAPEAGLSRATAIKYVVRALGLEDAAVLAGIYKAPFTDITEENCPLIGHIAIAKGMGIINGADGKFNPDRLLERADAIIIIYNYLSR